MTDVWIQGRLNNEKWNEIDAPFHSVDPASGRRCPPAPCKKRKTASSVASEASDPFGMHAAWEQQEHPGRQIFFAPEDELKYQLSAAMSDDEKTEIHNRFVVRFYSEQFRENHGRDPTLSEGANIVRIVTLKYPMVFPIPGM
jgi:hypothetical protein